MSFNPSMPPFYANVPAIGLPHGTLLSPGGRVAAYVRATAKNDDPPFISENRVASINEACKRVRSGQSDVIEVLEGHTESISTADFWSNLKAGTKIVSAGVPGSTNNATLTWTATAAQLLIDVADVTIAGFNMSWIGVDDIVLPISVTAAGCVLADNVITAESASAGVLKGVEVAVGGSGFRFLRNTVLSVGEAHPLTSAVVLISGAADNLELSGNYVSAANPGTNVLGLFAVTAAATNVRIVGNTMIQLESAGTADFAITVGAVAATGTISNNYIKTASAAVGDVSGVSVNAAAQATMGLFENYVAGPTVGSGLLSPDAVIGT
jgi:hypothetical protein